VTDKSNYPPVQPRTWRNRDPLRISFLGFNPFGDGYDGRGKIDVGADRTFTSLDTLGALTHIRQYFDINDDGRLSATDGPPFDLRMTGYSFGGWSALQVVHALAPFGQHFHIRLGLVDPVSTFRPRWGLRLAPSLLKVSDRLSVPWLAVSRGPVFGSRPPYVVWAENYFQTKGLIPRFNGDGFRLPFWPKWFASQAIEGFANHDVSAEVTEGGGHVEIAERYAQRVARETFG
jgi:hypothetical protein